MHGFKDLVGAPAALLTVALAFACGDAGDGSTSEDTGSTSAPTTSTSAPTTDTATGTTDTATGTGTSAGTDDSSTGSETGTDTDTSTTTTGGGVMVPEPCDTVVADFTDDEPNDTPEQAIDGCTVINGYWGNFPQGGFLGPDDEVDYVVFKTPDEGGDVSVPINPCWVAGPNLVDWYLYEIVDGLAQEPAVLASETPDTSCEGNQMLTFPPNTAYLLELRRAEMVNVETQYFW